MRATLFNERQNTAPNEVTLYVTDPCEDGDDAVAAALAVKLNSLKNKQTQKSHDSRSVLVIITSNEIEMEGSTNQRGKRFSAILKYLRALGQPFGIGVEAIASHSVVVIQGLPMVRLPGDEDPRFYLEDCDLDLSTEVSNYKIQNLRDWLLSPQQANCAISAINISDSAELAYLLCGVSADDATSIESKATLDSFEVDTTALQQNVKNIFSMAGSTDSAECNLRRHLPASLLLLRCFAEKITLITLDVTSRLDAVNSADHPLLRCFEQSFPEAHAMLVNHFHIFQRHKQHQQFFLHDVLAVMVAFDAVKSTGLALDIASLKFNIVRENSLRQRLGKIELADDGCYVTNIAFAGFVQAAAAGGEFECKESDGLPLALQRAVYEAVTWAAKPLELVDETTAPVCM